MLTYILSASMVLKITPRFQQAHQTLEKLMRFCLSRLMYLHGDHKEPDFFNFNAAKKIKVQADCIQFYYPVLN